MVNSVSLSLPLSVHTSLSPPPPAPIPPSPLALGVEEGVSVGDTRVFLSHAGCRGGLDLKEGTDYLIMGPKTDLWYKDSSTNR